MLRTLVLFAPVFVSLFWAITIAGDKKKHGTPRLFLSKFMILVAVLFSAHFFYFAPLPGVYLFFDIPLQFIGLSVFPLYHIYFRLLTVDEKFVFRKHAWYLVIPVVIGLIYCIAVLTAPFDVYKVWLYDSTGVAFGEHVPFLNIMRKVIKITFLVTILLSLSANYWLILKYGHKAEAFYSDIRDAKQKNAKLLIYSILLMGLLSVVIVLVGRSLLLPSDWYIYAGWTLFSILVYIMGISGVRQKPLNPYFEPLGSPKSAEPLPVASVYETTKFHNLLREEFANNKIYLNSELNIMDVVRKLGTNRTYLSTFINQQFNQNFCTFVNTYRIEELHRVVVENPLITNEELAERCGFGSVNSMKRSVSVTAGMSLQEFRSQ